jgi:hypothetical protein
MRDVILGIAKSFLLAVALAGCAHAPEPETEPATPARAAPTPHAEATSEAPPPRAWKFLEEAASLIGSWTCNGKYLVPMEPYPQTFTTRLRIQPAVEGRWLSLEETEVPMVSFVDVPDGPKKGQRFTGVKQSYLGWDPVMDVWQMAWVSSGVGVGWWQSKDKWGPQMAWYLNGSNPEGKGVRQTWSFRSPNAFSIRSEQNKGQGYQPTSATECARN